MILIHSHGCNLPILFNALSVKCRDSPMHCCTAALLHCCTAVPPCPQELHMACVLSIAAKVREQLAAGADPTTRNKVCCARCAVLSCAVLC